MSYSSQCHSDGSAPLRSKQLYEKTNMLSAGAQKFDNSDVNSLEEKLKRRAAANMDAQMNKVNNCVYARLLMTNLFILIWGLTRAVQVRDRRERFFQGSESPPQVALKLLLQM
jgi:hypothetical protein